MSETPICCPISVAAFSLSPVSITVSIPILFNLLMTSGDDSLISSATAMRKSIF